jgi:F-type H+-transporting ATPase subunit alpha
VETQAGDVSAYIPTNVISITDGQIFLETDLFNAGQRPAVNPGLSVSRVGGDAQIKAMKEVCGNLRLELAQYRELEAFSQFASDLDEITRKQLNRGQRLMEMIKQPVHAPWPVACQIAMIYAGVHGYLDDIPVSRIKAFERELFNEIESRYAEYARLLQKDKELTEEIKQLLDTLLSECKKRL